MTALHALPSWTDAGELRVVVEAPRGAGAKLKWDPTLEAFELGRLLSLGLTYPFDWGFIPGTEGPDGDPLDALVLSDVPTWPGVVIPCRPLGLLMLSQKGEGKGRERNDRLIAVPVGSPRLENLRSPSALSRRMREELEQFFLSSVFFTQKDPKVLGWRGPREATAWVRGGGRQKT